MTDTSWMNIPLDKTTIKRSMIVVLKARLGDDATLGDVAQMKLSELKSLKGVGKVAIDSCMEAIRHAVHGAPPPSGPTLLEVVNSAAQPAAEEAMAA